MKWFDHARIIEACVLSLISKNDSYGYELIKSNALKITESSLYPVLRRLTTKGYLESYSKTHKSKLRKYYRITSAGQVQLVQMKKEWKDFNNTINSFLEEKHIDIIKINKEAQ